MPCVKSVGTALAPLRAVARALGVGVSYINARGERVSVPAETLAAMITALCPDSCPVQEIFTPDLSPESARAFLAHRRAETYAHGLPPVIVAWDKQSPDFFLYVPVSQGGVIPLVEGSLRAEIRTEGQGKREKPLCAAVRIVRRHPVSRDGKFFRLRVSIDLSDLAAALPWGCHDLGVFQGASPVGSALLICAPQSVVPQERSWGVFAPTYAIRSGQDHGIGGFKELHDLAAFIRSQGGDFVGTLPLLAGDMEGDAADISPYAPLSRLFWNEIFLDLDSLPAAENPPVCDLETLKALRAADYTDYARVYALKKPIIAAAAEAFFTGDGVAHPAYRKFLTLYPFAEDYARFRAARSRSADTLESGIRFHLYAQFACHTQMERLRHDADSGDIAALYLDYPVGVHIDGFDMHCFGDLFLAGFDVGAPPDPLCADGQNWGFRALDPRKMIQDRFTYVRQTFAHYFRCARIVRIDHIMGLYRLYCIPSGRAGAEGAYLHYPFEPLMALLSLEASRHGGTIVGEDLGTVPPAVRTGMDSHGFLRMWVFPFEFWEHADGTVDFIPENCIAGLNTHDMYPFEAFITGADLQAQVDSGALDPVHRDHTMGHRKWLLNDWHGEGDILAYVLQRISASKAHLFMANIEDLWREERPQNVPGLVSAANWSRKFPEPLETWTRREDIRALLSRIDQNRRL